jgi:hypothetical protein
VVAREVLREVANGAPDGFGYGVLWARQEQVGEQTRAELPPVIAASRGTKVRGWLG